MKLLEAPNYHVSWPKQLLNITRECERIYYTRELEQSEEMFLIEQFAVLYTNLLGNHPELAQDFQNFIDHLRKL